MSQLSWISGFYLTQTLNRIKHPGKEGVTRFILMLFFAMFFFPVVYQLFYFIFRHFYGVSIIGPILVSKLLYAFYMTFSFMIVLSAIVSAIPVLYLGRDMDFMFSLPLKTESIFTVQYSKIITEATWMIFIMAVPIFGAYSRVLKVGLYEYLFILFAHLPLFIIMGSIGILLTVMLVRFFPAESIRNIAIAFGGIVVVMLVIYFRMLQPEKLTGAGTEQVMEFIKGLRTPENPLLPHTHFVGLVNAVTKEGIINALSRLAALFGAAALAFAAVLLAAGRWYFEGYAKRGARRKERPLPADYEYRPQGIFSAQLSKDGKYLARDTSQWIQVVFLAGLVVIYLYNIYKLPADLFNLKNFVYFLNIGFIGFVLSAVGARFVLPVISTEGRGFWIFRAAPITMKKYVLFKFLVYSLPIIFTGQAVAVLSTTFLKSDLFINVITITSTFLITLVISGTGMGLGAYFANFGIKNPEELITGIAGLTYMFITMLFTGILLVIEAGMVRDYYLTQMVKAKHFLISAYYGHFAVLLLIAALAVIIPLWAGIKRLEKIEV